MLTVNLLLQIDPGQMVCGDCSRAIRTSVVDFLNEQQYPFFYVSTDFRKKTLEIAGLTLKEGQSVKEIYEALVAALQQLGYDCIGYTNLSSDLASQASDPVVVAATFSPFMQSIPPLTLGLSLMLAEHLGWLPKPSAKDGLAVNLTVGIIATLMSGYFGQSYFRHAWRNQGAMDSLISLGTLTAISYSFLLIAQPPFINDDTTSVSFSLPLMIFGLLTLSHGVRDRIHAYIETQLDCLDMQKRRLPLVAQTYLVAAEQHEAFMLSTSEKDFLPFASCLEQLPVNGVPIGSIICVEKKAIVPIDAVLIGNRQVSVREDFYGKKGLTLKEPNATIFAGAENSSDHALFLKTLCLAADNHVNKVYASVKVRDASDTYLELVSQYFLRGVLSIAFISALGWGIFGPQPAVSNAIKVWMAVLLSACPCGLGLIDLNASMVKYLALEEGILIQKDTIFNLDRATDVCLDKCGTLTTGKYELEEMLSVEGSALDEQTENHYLAQAMLLEQELAKKNPTTIASAIIEAGKKRQLALSSYTLSAFTENAVNKGRGGTAMINNSDKIIIGNKAFLTAQGITLTASCLEQEKCHAQKNRLAIFLAINKAVSCLLILKSATETDQILRPGVKAVLEWLLQQGKKIHILTGDSEERTKFLVAQLKLNQSIILRCLQQPTDKIAYVAALKQVIMLGDDDNDRAAMLQATYGLAIDHLAPIRGDADAILNGTFMALVQLMSLAKTYRQSYFGSLLLVFGLNGLSTLAAAGLFYPLTHQFVDPMITGMAMVGAPLLVLTNIACFKYLGAQRQTAIKHIFLPPVEGALVQRAFSSKLFGGAKRQQEESVLTPLLGSMNEQKRDYALDSIL